MSAETPKKETIGSEQSGAHSGNDTKETFTKSPSNPPKPEAKSSYANPYASKRKKESFLRWGKFAVELLTLIVVAVYTRIAYHQWEQMRRATGDSEESFRLDERAWIEIEPIKPILLVRDAADTGDLFTCNIYLRNLGKTVASNISVRAADPMSTDGWDENAQVVSKSQDMIPSEIPSSRVPRVLAPNEIAAAPFRLDCQAPQTFKSGHQMIHYLIGRIDYVDQFRIPHWKRFCYFVVNNRGEIWNCQQGNDEDKNPETPPN
jgi:hypothetical protein